MRWILWSSLAGCGTLTYYDKGVTDPDTDTVDVETTPGDDDDDGPGDDDDDDPPVDTATTDTDDTETTSGVCTYPSLAGPTGNGPNTAMPSPTWIAFSFVGFVIDDQVEDYTVDGTDYSALFIVEFFDASYALMCEVVYDASQATPATGWTTDSGGQLFASFELNPSNGASTCGVTAGQVSDLRDFIENYTWGFSVGELVGNEAALQQAVTDDGQNWAADWAPYTYGTYISGGLFGPVTRRSRAGGPRRTRRAAPTCWSMPRVMRRPDRSPRADRSRTSCRPDRT